MNDIIKKMGFYLTVSYVSGSVYRPYLIDTLGLRCRGRILGGFQYL